MKAHLDKGNGFIACGRSGRRRQSKNVISGFTPKYFKSVPEDERCVSCSAKLKEMEARKKLIEDRRY